MKRPERSILPAIIYLSLFLSIPFIQNAQELSIIPEPKELNLLGKAPFRISSGTKIIINSKTSANDMNIADGLNAAIYRLTGYNLDIALTMDEGKQGLNHIIIGEPGTSQVLKNQLEKYNIGFKPGNAVEQGYIIYSDYKVLLLAGNDQAGTFYALQSLLGVLRSDKGNTIDVPNMLIRDYPEIKYRGLFNENKWGPDRMTLEDYKDMIDYMASIKMNTLSVGVYGCWGVQYRNELLEFFMLPVDKYPQLRTPKLIEYYSPERAEWKKINYLPEIFEKDFFSELIKYGKTKHVTVYPSFNSLGHNTLLPRIFPEIAALDEKGNPKSSGFCTTNEKTYKILFNIYDNIIDKYLKPNGIDWFDIQMDEVGQWDARDLKKFSEEEIYLNHMLRLSKYLKSKGMNHIGVWTDMLENKKIFNEQLKEKVAEAGLDGVMRFQWWKYGGAYKTTYPELGLRTWVYPMTGYTYPYHFTYPVSRLDNVYQMLALGHNGKAEGASSYSIYDPAYDYEIRSLADFSWNKVEPDKEKALNDYTRRYSKDLFGKKWQEAEYVLKSLEELYSSPQILNTILYYKYSYVRVVPYKKNPYPESAFNALGKIPDAREKLVKLGGIAGNAASFLISAANCSDENKDVIMQMYANILRMSLLIREFLLLYDIDDEYRNFKKLTVTEERLNSLGKIKNITREIMEYQRRAISTWEEVKPQFLHHHEMRNMSFMLKFCEENIKRTEQMESDLKNNYLKEVPETLITGTSEEL